MAPESLRAPSAWLPFAFIPPDRSRREGKGKAWRLDPVAGPPGQNLPISRLRQVPSTSPWRRPLSCGLQLAPSASHTHCRAGEREGAHRPGTFSPPLTQTGRRPPAPSVIKCEDGRWTAGTPGGSARTAHRLPTTPPIRAPLIAESREEGVRKHPGRALQTVRCRGNGSRAPGTPSHGHAL